MNTLLSCEFNIDTACVELRYSNGAVVAIDAVAVENEIAYNIYQRSELDWLIYNKPLEYVQLVLGKDMDEYLKVAPEQGFTILFRRGNSTKRSC